MPEPSVRVDERLASAGLATVMGVVLMLFIDLGVVIQATTNGETVSVAVPIVAGVVIVVLGGLFVLALRIRAMVEIREDGPALVVAYGPGGLVRQVFAASQIVGVEVQAAAPSGVAWGYRGSLRLRRHASLVTRRGPLLVLTLTGQRRFSLAVADPGAFLAALAPTSG